MEENKELKRTIRDMLNNFNEEFTVRQITYLRMELFFKHAFQVYRVEESKLIAGLKYSLERILKYKAPSDKVTLDDIYKEMGIFISKK